LIDFRYHLISLIAVFLALGLGILMGSVVLSEKYVQRLENRVAQFEEEVDARRGEISDLNDRLDAFQEYAVESQPRLIDGALAGEEVVLVQTDGTDEAFLEGMAEAVEEARGTLVSTITLTDRFALADQPERDGLAAILGSVSTEATDLRDEAGTQLGERIAAVAASRPDATFGDAAAQRLTTLTRTLEDEGFLGVSSNQETFVPAGASFIVAGGSTEERFEGAVDLTKALALGLSDRERAVMVAEPSTSTWELVQAVRDDGSLSAAVSSADHAETVPGRVAVVLGLEMTIDGLLGHYGVADGAAGVIPPPTPRA
jgi:hypothetical protein